MRRGREDAFGGTGRRDVGEAAPLPGRCLSAARRDATPELRHRFPAWAHPRSEAHRRLMVRLTVRLAYWPPDRRRAARSVFTSSIARVIGPTPPGTGVIAAAFSATAS
jgi:hypothetical protein